MRRKFRDYPINEPLLLPYDLQEWLPEDHLARFLSEVIEQIDMSAFFRAYDEKNGRGKPPYHPAMMLKLWLYGYATGVHTSRKIEKATYENVAFRYLAANQHPDHDSLAAFRARHSAGVKAAFLEVLSLCRKMGLVSLGVVAVDGTKIKANASLKNTVKEDDLDKELKAQQKRVDELIARAESEERDDQDDPTKLPRALSGAKARAAKLAEAKARADQERKEKNERRDSEEQQQLDVEAHELEIRAENGEILKQLRKSRNLTQSKLAEKTGVPQPQISHFEHGTSTPSQEQLLLLAQQLGKQVLEMSWELEGARKLCATTSLAVPRVNLTDADSRTIKPKATASTIQGFNAQLGVCSDHQIIVAAEVTSNVNDHGLLPSMVAMCASNLQEKPKVVLADCGYFSIQTIQDSRLEGIDIYVPPKRSHVKAKNQNPIVTEMREKVDSPEGKALYKKRAHTAEPPFARMKVGLKFMTFQLRGLTKVNIEFGLMAAVCNILKMHRYRNQ